MPHWTNNGACVGARGEKPPHVQALPPFDLLLRDAVAQHPDGVSPKLSTHPAHDMAWWRPTADVQVDCLYTHHRSEVVVACVRSGAVCRSCASQVASRKVVIDGSHADVWRHAHGWLQGGRITHMLIRSPCTQQSRSHLRFALAATHRSSAFCNVPLMHRNSEDRRSFDGRKAIEMHSTARLIGPV